MPIENHAVSFSGRRFKLGLYKFLMRETVTFNGVEFVRYPKSKSLSGKRYFYPNSRKLRKIHGALHQAVWRHHNGPIPDGYDIHHKNDEWSNNDIGNLECLTPKEHRDRHAGTFYPKVVEHLDRVRPLTKAWHASEEGRQWHIEHGKATFGGPREEHECTCEVCGKKYTSKARIGHDRFCGHKCAQQWYYENKTFWVEQKCPECGKSFLAPPGRKDQCCSRSCGCRRGKRKQYGRISS